MNARERMLAAINHQPVDRIPLDIWAETEVWQKLRRHFGEGVDVSEALHLDGMASVDARYAGPARQDGEEMEDFWGTRYRRMNHGSGTYHELCYSPLAEARTIDDLERHRWPSADWFDYSHLKEAAQANQGRQLLRCGSMWVFAIHKAMRGLEQSLTDSYDDPELTHHLLGRVSDFLYAHHRRMFEACDGLVDISDVTDDFGMQTAPLISLDTFRTFYRPHLERFTGLCREFGIKVFHHDDGAIRPFLPDLIEIGIDVLNPVQAVCPGMEMEGLKRDFGQHLCFHGGIDNQYVLPFGTPEEVRAAVRAAIDALASDGTGYILAPCHSLQPVTPLGNIIAMYDEAWRYGRR